MFNSKDKLDKMLMKISLYVILTFAIAYAISRVLFYVPDIFKGLISFISVSLNLLAPFIYGLVIAYLIWPLVNLINKSLFKSKKKTRKKTGNNEENEEGIIKKVKHKKVKDEKKWKTGVSVLISYLIVFGFIIFLVYFTYVAIEEKFVTFEFGNLMDVVTNYIKTYDTKITEIVNTIKSLEIPTNIKDQLLGIIEVISKAVTDFGAGIVGTITGISKNVVNLFIGVIIAFYLVVDYEFFKEVWNKFLMLFMKKKKRTKVNNFLSEINAVLSNFVRGQLLDCFIVALISIIVLLIVNIDFAVILGIFAGIANVIPYFGPIIGMVPAVIVGLLSGEPLKALFAIIALIIVQQVDGNIIAPRIIGGSVGLHPVFVVIAVLVGAYLGGIGGMILAVPVCGIIKVIITKILYVKELEEEKER